MGNKIKTTRIRTRMKTNFASAAIAAVYLAISAQGQNNFRFLNDTCEQEATATMKAFDAVNAIDTETFNNETLYIMGKDERAVCTDEDEIEIGFDNLAWVYEDSPDEVNVFKPNYLGGSLKFNVDVSDVGCNCAAGVFLLTLDDELCTRKDYESDAFPTQCSTIEVMKANQLGFGTESNPYEANSTPVFCKSDILTSLVYGPGTAYTINTLEPYHVTTEFIANTDNNLTHIRTYLYQNFNHVPIELECDFKSMDQQLNKNMGLAISTYSLDATNNPLTDQCSQVCSSGSTIVSGLEWTEGPEIVNDDSEESGSDDNDTGSAVIVWGEAAPSLTSGECANVNCSECRQSWYDNNSDEKEYRCKDETVYSYGDICDSDMLAGTSNLCMTEERWCHWSFPAHDAGPIGPAGPAGPQPAGDPDENSSEQAACRSIPRSYWRGNFNYGELSNDSNKGLCHYGCDNYGGTCHWSWSFGVTYPEDDPKAMYRCYLPY